MNAPGESPTQEDFERLLTFRDGLRRFLAWSEEQAKAAGITSSQHQLMLAIAGHGTDPNMSDLAEHLMLKHHSAVELVDRAVTAGLVRRGHDADDHRVVRVSLTAKGFRTLAQLSAAHLEELSRIGPAFAVLWSELPVG